jgi:Cd2+/Zn2+-exporting ATPase
MKDTTLSRIFVPAMDCPDEEREIRAVLGRMPSVVELTFHLFSRQIEVRHRGGIEEVLSELSAAGMEGHPVDESLRKADIPEPSKASLADFFLSAALLLGGGLAHLLLQDSSWPPRLFLAAVVAGGWRIAVRGARELRNRSLGMNALMSISISGAAVMGDLAEAAAVVTLFALANHLEARSLDRARRATAELFVSSPVTAVVREGGVHGRERTVAAEEVRAGDLMIIRPGERVPVDAVVFKGSSDLNEAILTGESKAVEKDEGDPLYAGTVNGRSLLLAYEIGRAHV